MPTHFSFSDLSTSKAVPPLAPFHNPNLSRLGTTHKHSKFVLSQNNHVQSKDRSSPKFQFLKLLDLILKLLGLFSNKSSKQDLHLNLDNKDLVLFLLVFLHKDLVLLLNKDNPFVLTFPRDKDNNHNDLFFKDNLPKVQPLKMEDLFLLLLSFSLVSSLFPKVLPGLNKPKVLPGLNNSKVLQDHNNCKGLPDPPLQDHNSPNLEQ